MSNRTENSKETKPTGAEINEKLNEAFLGLDVLPVSKEEAFKIMAGAKIENLEELTSEYFNFEKVGVYDFILTGFTVARIEGKEVECVTMENEKGESLINGNAVLVNSAKKVSTMPCFLKVNYVGDVKTKAGSYKNLKVYTFPLSQEAKQKANENKTNAGLNQNEKAFS